MNITIVFQFDDQLIDDLLSTCFEGGSTYWCDRVKVKDGDYKGADFASEVISKGGTLLLYAEGSAHELTLEKFIKGMELGLQDNPRLVLLFKGGDVDWDGCGWDAGHADHILQHALFGELIYG